MDIGNQIKKLRTQQNRTLQEIANDCRFTKSLLSKIENGVVIPPVATLAKIAKALGVKISVLVEEGESTGSIYEPEEKIKNADLVKTDRGYSYYVFASEHGIKKMQPFLFTAKKGEVIKHELSHEGEEFIYMLEGEIKFKVGSIEYILKAGDSLYFDAIEKHGFMIISDFAKYLDIFTE